LDWLVFQLWFFPHFWYRLRCKDVANVLNSRGLCLQERAKWQK
jgi:hypothetical protein